MNEKEFNLFINKTLNSYYSCNSILLLCSLPNTNMQDYYQIFFNIFDNTMLWRYFHFRKILKDNDIKYDEPDYEADNISKIFIIHKKYRSELERILFLFKIEGHCNLIKESSEF